MHATKSFSTEELKNGPMAKCKACCQQHIEQKKLTSLKNCLSPEEEKKIAQEKHWKNEKHVFVRQGKKGCIFYDYCFNTANEAFGSDEPQQPIEGKYSVVFGFRWWPGLSHLVRTVNGTVTLEKAVTEETSRYQAKLEFDGEKSGVDISNCTISGPTTPYENPESPWMILFDDIKQNGTNHDPDNSFLTKGEIDVFLNQVNRRLAFPWKPVEQHSNDRCIREFGADKCVQFDTMQEADALTRQYEDHRPTWIGRHLDFPPPIVEHIHAYSANWRPPPVFYVETGDLVLGFIFVPTGSWSVQSQLVLRKKD